MLSDLFSGCLVGESTPFANLPLFTRCRNVTCVEQAHRQLGGRHLPPTAIGKPAKHTGELGELTGAPRMRGISEVACETHADEVMAVELAVAAVRWSLPLVLRGCARAMPAVSRWTNATYLRAVAADAFAPVLGQPPPHGNNMPALDDLPPDLLADSWWPSPFGEKLFEFARNEHTKTLWATSGGKKAAAHYDTFDNFHVVVGGQKEFRLVSPAHASAMYVDFPKTQCPNSGQFGCDGLGCYAFVPFDATSVDLEAWPRVADAQVMVATLDAGDTLLIPAFWFHYIKHYPLSGAGRCLALTFTRQQRWERRETMGPFAADLEDHWQRRAGERERDPTWHARLRGARPVQDVMAGFLSTLALLGLGETRVS